MIGILTEKPSAQRNFAKALGGMSGTFNGEEYIITSARGHLYEYVDPADQVPEEYVDKFRHWDLKYLPWEESLLSWKMQLKKGAEEIIRQIKSDLRECSEIVIATDVDPTGEGELLAWEILHEQRLTQGKRVTRMYFDDESEKEIRKAFGSRKEIQSMEQDMDYVKAKYRSKWDLLSMQFTRIATNYSPDRAVLRQGRLKSVMVKTVGDGLRAVSEYKKVITYTNKFRDENGVLYADPKEPQFPTKEQVPRKYVDSAVIRDAVTMKKTPPPKLIDLAMLSARLSTMGYSADLVLDTYQKMYEAQVVSYPRTEDKVITPEQFQELLPLVDKIANVVGVESSLLTHRTMRNTHVKSGGAHGANRPGPNVPSSYEDLKQYGKCAPAIYEILAKNYLSMLAEDYEYESQRGHLEKYPGFVGTASIPKKMGWKQVFDDEAEPDENENKKGLGTMASPFIAEIVNKKPPIPTMKWLMKQLEKYDVGTGATRTSTYADVTNAKTKYSLLSEKNGKLSMSSYGEQSYLLLEGTLIGDVKMTEYLMCEMRDIAAGKADPQACLKKVQEYVRHDMDTFAKNANAKKDILLKLSGGKLRCPVCGNLLRKMDWGYGCAGYQSGCKFAVGRICGKILTEEQMADLIYNGQTATIRGFRSNNGTVFDAKLKFDLQKDEGGKVTGCKMSFVNNGLGVSCPVCGKPLRKMEWGYGCSGFRDGCRFSIGKICGKMLSVQEVKSLLDKGEVHLNGLVSNSGKIFSSDICLVKETGEDGRVRFHIKFKEQQVTSLMCPDCGKTLVKTSWGFACKDYKKSCNFAVGEICGHRMTENELKMLLRDGIIGPIKGLKSSSGNIFESYFVLSEENGVNKIILRRDNTPSLKNEKKDLYVKCPSCHSNIVRGEYGWECEAHCGIMIPYVKNGLELEEKYAEALLMHGNTDFLQGFVSKAGKPFTAALKLNGKKLEFIFPDWKKK